MITNETKTGSTTRFLASSAATTIAHLSLPLVTVIVFGACDQATKTPPPVDTTPTWHEHVAPIIAEHCLRCHTEGSIAPFQFSDYASAKPLAATIASVTKARSMPPFLADNSGECNTWRDSNWLTDEEIVILSAWANGGAPEGTPRAAPVPPTLPKITAPDIVLQMDTEFTPSSSLVDEYRCFLVDPMLTEDSYVTQYEVIPGEPRVVHHVIIYSLKTPEAETQATSMDGADGRPGYSCYGGAGVPSRMLAGWAPGTGAISFPSGTGIDLSAGRKLVMQVHYNMVGGAFPDRSSIKLMVDKDTANPGILSIFGNSDLEIPPGLTDHEEVINRTVREAGANKTVYLWGIFPHLHELGTTFRLERIRGAEQTCLIDVPRWDFNWQFGYFLETPIELQPDDIIRLTCQFDSRSRTETTYFGEGTQDEMCLAPLFVTLEP